MRSGVGWCFMELFVVCIHINNVDPQKLVQVGKRANCSPLQWILYKIHVVNLCKQMIYDLIWQ